MRNTRLGYNVFGAEIRERTGQEEMPEGPYKKPPGRPISMRIDEDVRTFLEARALADDRTLSAYVNRILREYVRDQQRRIASDVTQVGRHVRDQLHDLHADSPEGMPVAARRPSVSPSVAGSALTAPKKLAKRKRVKRR